jgi:acetoin utilization deacetylase AcuC-like enzyme
LVIYNNGADVLKGDTFKADLNISQEGLQKRDLEVCRFALTREYPFCMVLSGGYGQKSASAMATSVGAVMQECQRLCNRPTHALKL